MPKIVETFDELVEVVLNELPAETLLELRKMKWHQLGDAHFGLGMYLRNEYIYPSSENLWENRLSSTYKYPLGCPDSLSAYLIEVLWLRLNNRKNPPLVNRIWDGFWNFLGYIAYILYFKPKIDKESKERPELERPSKS